MPPPPHRLTAPLDGRAVFDKAVSWEGLMAGLARVRQNAGSAGGDGVTIDAFAAHAGERIAALSAALRDGSYRPGPLRVAFVDKAGGGSRKLTIPSVRDRVAQSSVAQILTPLLDAEMEDASFGYRPGRGVVDAVKRVEILRRQGFIWTVDADIDDFFDTIPIDALLARFSQSVSDSPLTDLLALWLEQAAERGRGIAQGSPLSPLLSNLYLDVIDETLSRDDLRIVRYADDFLLLAKDRPTADSGFARVEKLLVVHGLRLDPEKTRIAAYDDSLRFLGHVFVRGWAVADPAGGNVDGAQAALRRLAEDDHRAAETETAAAEDDAQQQEAGYDRGLRVLHVVTKGRRLALRNQSFAVHEAEEALGGELIAVHHSRVDRIEIGAGVETDLETLRHALACAIPVSFLDGHGRAVGHLAPSLSPHAGRHLAQSHHALDPALRLELARILVVGRLANQRALLRRVNHRRGIDAVANAAALLTRSMDKTKCAKTVEIAMGFEGAGARVYWKAWGRLLLGGYTFTTRARRTGADPVNAALDLSSWLLARDIGAVVLSAGLHPGFGVLHATSDFRDACVFDLMEEFRAGLVESLVLAVINGGALRAEMFSSSRLSRQGADTVVRRYEERCEGLVKSPRSGKRVTWRRLMREQAESYAAHIEGRSDYRPFVIDH